MSSIQLVSGVSMCVSAYLTASWLIEGTIRPNAEPDHRKMLLSTILMAGKIAADRPDLVWEYPIETIFMLAPFYSVTMGLLGLGFFWLGNQLVQRVSRCARGIQMGNQHGHLHI